jgi:hypothetical protein
LQQYKHIYRTKKMKPGAQAQKAEGVQLFKLGGGGRPWKPNPMAKQ